MRTQTLRSKWPLPFSITRKKTGGRLRILLSPPTSRDDEVVVEWRLAPEGSDLNLETFVFDFSGDLYGAQSSVALVAFLRGEENFDGLETLIKQMDADSAEAREILGAL